MFPENVSICEYFKIGTLRSGDGKENVKKASKTTLHVHHAFLYISLPSLLDYDVKMPNFTFYGGCKQARTKFSYSFWTWPIYFIGNQLQVSSPSYQKGNEFE